MARLLILVLLLACLVGQSFASVRAAVAPQGEGDLAHALLHWGEEAHHHHGGDIHQDDSDASISHVMTDHMGGSVALSSCAPSLGKFSSSDVLPATPQAQVPAPVLDGLFRPPRA